MKIFPFSFLAIALALFLGIPLLAQERDKSTREHYFITTEEYSALLNENPFLDLGGASDLYESEGGAILRLGEPGNYHYELAPAVAPERAMLFLSKQNAEAYCQWKNSLQKEEEWKLEEPPPIDSLLKSNGSPFSLLSSGASVHESTIEEEVVVRDAVEKVMEWLLAGCAFLAEGQGIRGRESSSHRPHPETPARALRRESLANGSNPFGVTPPSPERQNSSFTKCSGEHQKKSSEGETYAESLSDSSGKECIDSAVEECIKKYQRSSDLFKHLPERESYNLSEQRTISHDSDISHLSTSSVRRSTPEKERERPTLDHFLPSAPPLEEASSLERKEASSLDAPLPRTGLTLREYSAILQDFTDWRDAIENYKTKVVITQELHQEIERCATILGKTEAKARYFFYPDKQAIQQHEEAEQQFKGVQQEYQETLLKMAASKKRAEELGAKLDAVGERLLPPIAEPIGEKYPRFELEKGVSFELAKQAYLKRKQIFESGDILTIENCLLYTFGARFEHDHLHRQAMLNQLALFEKEGYWLDFSNPLRGPICSFDREELVHRANQAHIAFIEAATFHMFESFRLKTICFEPTIRKNFFKMSVEELVRALKEWGSVNPLELKFCYSSSYKTGDLISFIKQNSISGEEIKKRAFLFEAQSQIELRKEAQVARSYFDAIFGSQSKITINSKNQVQSSSSSSLKNFLGQQLSYYLLGRWSCDLNFKNNLGIIATFPTQEEVTPYVNLVHRQSIKAASLLDQYRLMMLPSKERADEVACLQRLSPEEYEAGLFERAGITDWKLPQTEEELHAYVLREQAKQEAEEAAKKAEAAQKASSSSSYHKTSSSYSSSYGPYQTESYYQRLQKSNEQFSQQLKNRQDWNRQQQDWNRQQQFYIQQQQFYNNMQQRYR